ncbi:MAG: group 1 glycosyl transferase [Candidatus Moranbacteria bacterium CG23_combo_of_CG06-09_8_20_14_all_35_22]|nr:MAG: group 1 glycosyl transferase [Candidatus Moranbacteria bacterium CG23_combo_of_CG06-09_8_20_14_all_35_22]
MKIAIQVADLDWERIDGTRVYILNLLKYFGQIDPNSKFLIYHKKNFNPELIPPTFSNYQILKKPFPLFWTQIRLCHSLFQEKPNVLWMPMHNIPIFRSKKIKTIVTIHDLAFKYFPDHFRAWDLIKLNLLAGWAIEKSDKIITISEASKKDILKFYPKINSEKIKVIYHGFDKEIFEQGRDLQKEQEIKNKLNIEDKYILYIGALQPRKNLKTLISAFEELKKSAQSGSTSGGKYKDLKLVLAGEKAWLWKEIFSQIENSSVKNEIITPGKIKFSDIGHLMRGAEIFCFPSLYEGFGIPVLEAFISRVPVICANNSSLSEVAGEAVLYFEPKNYLELSEQIKKILDNPELRKDLILKGLEQAQKFSWEKCARETLEYLKI